MYIGKIFVTGGAGFVGSHICKALAIAGFEPICFDNLSTGFKQAVQWGPLVIGDVRDKKKLQEAMVYYQPIAVIHCAASCYVGESSIDPSKYYSNNVVGSHTLFEVMLELNINRIIFSSSCAVYGNAMKIPIDEEHNLLPINPYGFTKLTVEKMLQDYDIAYQLKSISLRYFNVAGSDPDGDIGENHNPETHIIPLLLQSAYGIRPYFEIYGCDYPTADGTCIRDYVHVTDLAEAHILALKSLLGTSRSAVYNVGGGRGYSVREVILLVESITKKKIHILHSQARKGDPPELLTSSKRIIQGLEWKPKYQDLEVQILHAWQWLLKSSKLAIQNSQKCIKERVPKNLKD